MKKNILVLIFCYSLFSCKSQVQCSNEIVLINIDTLSRDKIAMLIAKVDSLSPKVIGLDILFLHRSDYNIDLQLVTSLYKSKNLVLARLIDDYSITGIPYKYISSAPEFLPNNAQYGFINAVLSQNEARTISSFSVSEMVSNNLEYHFSVRVALQFDSTRTQNFIRKNKNIVNIDFNDCNFKMYQSSQILRDQIYDKDIRNKIVLMGFLGPGNEDKFFLHSKGKNKEVYGVEYLGHIIAQIIK